MKQIARILGISEDLVSSQIRAHKDDIKRLDSLYDTFKGDMDINKRTTKGVLRPNFKYAGNHAKYISTIINSYFIGNAPKYSYDESTISVDVDGSGAEEVATDGSNQALKVKPAMSIADETTLSIADWYKKRHIAEHDFRMGKFMSIMGRSSELLYADPNADEVVIKLKALDPRQTIILRSDDIEESVVGAIYYFSIGKNKIKVYLYTDTHTHIFEATAIDAEYTNEEVHGHQFGSVPIIEYYNNDERQGDFEQVLTLINAYNQLMSDRINDKEQWVDAILVITGGKLPEGWSKDLKKDRLLTLPKDGSKAEWLTRAMDESSVEVLRKAIKEDLSQFSFVPNLTDENFAGTASGVALSFKLIGMELLIKEKETNFNKGLRLRLKRLFHVWKLTGKPEYDYENIEIEYVHSLPTNNSNIYDIIPVIRDLVSDETILEQLPFVKNAQDEMIKLRDQKKQALKDNQDAFGMGAYDNVFNKPKVDDETDEE